MFPILLTPVYRAASLWTHISQCVLPDIAARNVEIQRYFGRYPHRKRAELALKVLEWLSEQPQTQWDSVDGAVLQYIRESDAMIAESECNRGSLMEMVPCPWCAHKTDIQRPSLIDELVGATRNISPDVNKWGDWMRKGMESAMALLNELPTAGLLASELRGFRWRVFREIKCTPRELFDRQPLVRMVHEIQGTPQFRHGMLGSAFLVNPNGIIAAWEGYLGANPEANMQGFRTCLLEGRCNPFRQPLRCSLRALLKAKQGQCANAVKNWEFDSTADHREPAPGENIGRADFLAALKANPYAVALRQGLTHSKSRIFAYFATYIMDNRILSDLNDLRIEAMNATCERFGLTFAVVDDICGQVNCR